MANEIYKNIKSRHKLKNGTEAEWNLTNIFIPLKGEPIIYNPDETHLNYRYKIGDGVTDVKLLPFVDMIQEGNGENSIVGNDLENNKAYGKNAIAAGTNTTAGSNAFKIVAVDAENLTMTLNSIEGLEVGLECSCQYNNNYDLFGTITDVYTNNEPKLIYSNDNADWTYSYLNIVNGYKTIISTEIIKNKEYIIKIKDNGYGDEENDFREFAFFFDDDAPFNVEVMSYIDGYLEATITSERDLSGEFYVAVITNTSYADLGEIKIYKKALETSNIIKLSAIPDDTFIEGQTNTLWVPSHPELGDGETIIGDEAFATGYNNKSSQVGSFTAGGDNIAGGKYSAVFGDGNKAGYCSAVFGQYNNGHQWSLIGGYQNTLTAPFAFSAGGNNTVSAQYGNALGHSNTIEGEASFVTGTSSTVKSINSLASGVNNTIETTAKESLAVGSNNIIKAPYSAAIGFKHTINASANGRAFAAGNSNTVSHNFSAAIGHALTTSRDSQIVVGRQNINDSTAMFIVGNGTAADKLSNAFVVKETGDAVVSGALKAKTATISGDLYANAYTGTSGKVVINSSTNTATGDSSFSGGSASQALGRFSFAFGNGSIAGTANDNGKYAVAIGFGAKATHDGAVAIGWGAQALHNWSTVFGINTKTSKEKQLVCGTWNTLDTDSIFIVGNGTSDTNRNYALNVHNNGKAYLGSADIDETNDKSIVTKKYVDNKSYNWKDIKDAPDISTDSNYTTKISGHNVYAYANDTLDLNSSVIANIYANGEVNIGSSDININGFSTTIESPYGTVTIKNLVEPIKDTDAANKKYVDTRIIIGDGVPSSDLDCLLYIRRN